MVDSPLKTQHSLKLFITSFVQKGGKYIDYSTAWKAALFLGLVVWGINFSHGAMAALPAALKQATYTFFVAGFVVKLCENISLKIKLPIPSYFLATIIPSCIAITLTFLVHGLRGTPEPFNSTLPTILMAPPSFFVWAWRSRHQQVDNL